MPLPHPSFRVARACCQRSLQALLSHSTQISVGLCNGIQSQKSLTEQESSIVFLFYHTQTEVSYVGGIKLCMDYTEV